MIPQLDAALLARLRGTDQMPAQPILLPAENILATGQPQPAQPPQTVTPTITMMVPDEWVAQSVLPAMNVWRFTSEYDPTRFRTGFHSRPYVNPDGTSNAGLISTKPHQVPIKLTYEFGLKALLEMHMVIMRQAFLSRIRPGGYGATITVTTDDGDIEVPWHQIAYANLTQDNSSGQRIFEERYTYEMLAWLDADKWSTISTVQSIIITTYTEPYSTTDITDVTTDKATAQDVESDTITSAD